MANATDELRGRRRLVCAPRPPWTDSPIDPGFDFNVLAYSQSSARQWNSSSAIDFGDIGLNDFCVECWMRYFPDGQNWYRSDASPVGFNSVFCGFNVNIGAGNNFFGLGFDALNASATFGTGQSPPGNVYQVTGTPPDDGEWHHWCVNYDRSNLMTFYIDGVSLGTADISAEVANNITDGDNYYIGTLHAVTGVGGDTRAMGVLGAAAFHKQLLTVSEIKDSVFGQRTQLVTNTSARYDIRDTVRLNPSTLAFMDPETTAEYVPNGWVQQVRRTTLSATPLPYLLLQDSSGNDNHVGLRVPSFNHWVSFDPTWK